MSSIEHNITPHSFFIYRTHSRDYLLEVLLVLKFGVLVKHVAIKSGSFPSENMRNFTWSTGEQAYLPIAFFDNLTKIEADHVNLLERLYKYEV